uniref:Endolytic murein transglycosylase n=1 Tax=Magnetococcus massalia (strain MO-1) TaxID=451514 RepID=A0A1S7LF22_MAGMO|nr:putative YceG-like family protein [Candidatus Magnetococcus massalia]
MLKRTALALLLMLSTAGWVAWQQYQNFLQQSVAQSTTFTVAKGWGVKRIANELRERGGITSPLFFRFLVWQQKAGYLQAGTYQITQGMRPQDLLSLLSQGKVVSYRITFTEGVNLKELANQFQAKGWQQQSDHLLDGTLSSQLGDLLEPVAKGPVGSLEGRLFPTTYFYGAEEDGAGLIKRMARQLKLVMDRAWASRPKGYPLTRYEALILASIIEKETGSGEERALISGVFHNRLKRKMKLQSDPTVIYGIPNYQGNITRKHLRTPTPYNTYTMKGLPPTPICSPGEPAIVAAFHPAKTDALYFVARGDGTGRHRFAKTLKEHNRNVRRYLKQLRAQKQRGS